MHKGRRASRAALRAAQENWNPAKCLEKGLKTIIWRGETVRNAQKVLKTPPQSRILLQVTLGAAPNVAEMHEKGLQNRSFRGKRARNAPRKPPSLRPPVESGTWAVESGRVSHCQLEWSRFGGSLGLPWTLESCIFRGDSSAAAAKPRRGQRKGCATLSHAPKRAEKAQKMPRSGKGFFF